MLPRLDTAAMALHSLLLVTSAAALLAPPTTTRHGTPLKAVWSNANAIKDYHNMLSGVVNEGSTTARAPSLV